MAVLIQNLHSERSVKAKTAKFMTTTVVMLLTLTAAMLALGGVTLLFVGVAVGWLLVGLAAIPAMFVEWYHGELKSLPAEAQGNSVDAWLEASLLAGLTSHSTPKEVAALVGASQAGQFMAIRFGLTANLLLNIASEDTKQTDDIWSDARDIQQQTKSPLIHGGVVAAALIRQFPNYEGLLAQMHLEYQDILAGIRWYDHIQDLVGQQNRPKRTGGVARDWSFGYTPLLKRFGVNLSEQSGGAFTVELDSHLRALDQLIDTLGTNGRQNAAVIGSQGTGKTTLLHAFAERLLDADANVPSSLKFRQVYLLDSSALISAAPGRGELEGLIMRVLTEAYRAKNIIICLDNAQLFFEEGIGAVDLTNVLLPILEAGNLRLILTMDEQRLLQIGQRNPGLVNALNRISIAPASREETIQVMQDQLILTEYRRKVTYMHQSLAEAFRLSERYIHDLAMPGRALKLLESAASYGESGGKLITANSVQQAIEQTMNVKVGVANADAERETLLNLEEKIHTRMINQTRAVQVVSDALRRARAGVRNQDRPIGTFLFLGPTGVGKTELAKALADVYFGGEDRIIRLDLNEYVTLNDVSRLIADGAEDPNSLTARVMKQPFSVILLDEIEKAHPNVLTTLLQLLDEGILRDIKNREVSFRDAIVIATSNAGADKIREYIDAGKQVEEFEAQFMDELISSNQFRPEFLNRFDEIVTFRPLNKTELVQVIDLIIAGVNKTLSLQKVSVEVAEDAKLFLVDKGYDPRLGARPMRRVVQRAVENTVAKEMLGGNVTPGTTMHISLAQVQNILGAEIAVANIRSEQSAGESTT
ncbi:MAG: clp protease ATP binding subunit [Candidatus Saccharibacteria bacterium GW2011_GWC2_48_9]|nr:MAG: clp protease ATP binding subunit [Candidatus Saccharibacteria bacterium GW2011_GWC2_48_9]HCH34940.1 Clp protease [Candidatus Saccharibacteria bacterium]